MRASRGVAVALAAALAITTAAGSAVADDPPGTITLATGDSAMRVQDAEPIGAVTGGFAFHLGGAVTFVDGVGKRATYADSSNGLETCGPTSSVVVSGSGTSVHWIDAANGAGHDVTLDDTRSYVGPAPDGWLEYGPLPDSGEGSPTVALFHRVAAAGTETVVWEPTSGSDQPSPSDYVCDDQGFAFVSGYPDAQIYRQSFTGPPELVASFAEHGPLSLRAVSGGDVLYSNTSVDGSAGQTSQDLVRQRPGSAAVPVVSGDILGGALSNTETLYVLNMDTGVHVFRKALTGQAQEVSGFPAPWRPAPYNIRADVSSTGFQLGSQTYTADAALFSIVGTSATPVWTPPPGPMSAMQADSAPGRAVWSDDRKVGNAAWSRSITGTGTVNAGGEQLLGSHVSAGVISVDGRRVVWSDDATNQLVVHDGGSVATRTDVGVVTAMSGHRVLRRTGKTAYSVLDLVTGASMDVTGMTAMWGNSAVGVGTSGEIQRLDLTSGKRDVLVPANETGLDPAADAVVSIDQDVVAWAQGSVVRWRNLTTGKQVDLASPSTQTAYDIRVSGNRIAVGFGTGVSVYDAAGSKITDLSGYTPGFDPGASGLAWISGYPSNAPKLTTVPGAVLPPRHEGNPFLSKALDLTSTSPRWAGEWVFTEPLATCALVISDDSGKTIRTIDCDTRWTPLGEALASWDGKDASGSLVAPGTYGWALTGGDADGPLVDVDGTSAVKGSVEVTNGTTPPPPGTLTAPKPAITGTPAVGSKLTAVPGTWGPAPVTLTYQWSRNGTPISGATTATYTISTSDVGAQLTVTVTGTKAGYTTASRTSDPTAKVTAPPSPPAAPTVIRIGGADRIGTAIAASKLAFPAVGSAKAVVLSRHDDFADALAGTPLAGAAKAPLLMTRSRSLDAGVAAEIKRVLPAKGTVYLLGGTGALTGTVEGTLKSMGFTTVRVAGADRFATSVAVANQTAKVLGHAPTRVFVTTGMDFPDGLAAGATAGSRGATLVLTRGSDVPSPVRSYLTRAHQAGTPLVAVGGPSAKAKVAWDQVISGTDRYATAAQLAIAYWAKKNDPSDDPSAIGIATGQNWPDALSGGAFMAGRGPLLVSTPTSLRPVTRSAVHAIVASETPSTVRTGYVFGGAAVVNVRVLDAVRALLR